MSFHKGHRLRSTLDLMIISEKTTCTSTAVFCRNWPQSHDGANGTISLRLRPALDSRTLPRPEAKIPRRGNTLESAEAADIPAWHHLLRSRKNGKGWNGEINGLKTEALKPSNVFTHVTSKLLPGRRAQQGQQQGQQQTRNVEGNALTEAKPVSWKSESVS